MSYNTIQLQGIINNMDRFSPYLTNLFCPNTVFFDSEEVAFDKVFDELSLAPYVSPLVAGKVNAKDGFSTIKFKVPYIKDLDQVSPADGVKRSAGEGFMGTLTVEQRVAAERVRLLMRHEKRLSLRIEEQVSQLIKGGKVLCEGDGHPSVEVNFGMSADNNITLSGAAKWDALAATSDAVLESLETWAAACTTVPNMILMDKDAWKWFIKNNGVKELLSTDRRGDESTRLTLAPSNGEHVQFKGMVGSFAVYVYTGFYRNDAGDKVTFLDSGRVVMCSSNPGGAVAYGGIKDVHEMRAVRQFSKNWVSENPSAENLMSQSSPLAALPDIDSICTIKVL